MKTPLYRVHLALGARMVNFAGWDMPLHYTGILAEHLHTRTVASLFDTCHMGEFELRGSTAADDLERLLTCRISDLVVGQCRYGYLLNESGGVLDDVICFRLASDHFMLVVNASSRDTDREWIRDHLSPTTTFKDVSDSLAKLDAQGPATRREMEQAWGIHLPELGYFRFTRLRVGELDLLISRTGYTGEFGYELFFDARRASEVWEQLISRSRIRPAGLGARDTLRLEAGLPLYGHELGPQRTPVGVAGGRFIHLTKDFIGRTAVERELKAGAPQRLVGVRLDGRQAARAGDAVQVDGRTVGEVTSGCYAPSLGCAAALAYVARGFDALGLAVTLTSPGRTLGGRVETLPLYRNGTARGAGGI